jgi:hypothetical protein
MRFHHDRLIVDIISDAPSMAKMPDNENAAIATKNRILCNKISSNLRQMNYSNKEYSLTPLQKGFEGA